MKTQRSEVSLFDVPERAQYISERERYIPWPSKLPPSKRVRTVALPALQQAHSEEHSGMKRKLEVEDGQAAEAEAPSAKATKGRTEEFVEDSSEDDVEEVTVKGSGVEGKDEEEQSVDTAAPPAHVTQGEAGEFVENSSEDRVSEITTMFARLYIFGDTVDGSLT